MNFAQTIDPELPMIARRSWQAVLSQLAGEAVPGWCLPEPSAVQTSSRRLQRDAEEDALEDEAIEPAEVVLAEARDEAHPALVPLLSA